VRFIDVFDRMMSDERTPLPVNFAGYLLRGEPQPFDERDEVLRIWFAIVKEMRREPEALQHTPLTPNEIERLKRALNIIRDSVHAAHALQPSHFYVVPEGGR